MVKGELDYKIIVDNENELITVEVSGIISTQNASNALIAVSIENTTLDYKKILFDLTETKMDPNQSLIEMICFSNQFSILTPDKSIKISALVKHIDYFCEQLEEAAQGNGYQLRHFTNKNGALEWLNTL